MLEATINISVVVPLYNKQDHIVETLKTVLNQTRPADEIIVVDDGSTDFSVQRIVQMNNKRITILQQSNGGVSAARNTGLNAATSNYIAFLDGDDLWLPHFLEEMENLVVQHPYCGLFSAAYQYLDADGEYRNPKIRFDGPFFCTRPDRNGLIEDYFKVASQGDLPFNASSVMMKKSLLLALDGFPNGEAMGEDQDVWARSALQSKIAYCPRVLSLYNRAADNRACDQKPRTSECAFSKRLRRFAVKNSNHKMSTNILAYTAAHLRQLARCNIQAGEFETAKRILADIRCKNEVLKLSYCLGYLYLKQTLGQAQETLAAINLYTSNSKTDYLDTKLQTLRSKRRAPRQTS